MKSAIFRLLLLEDNPGDARLTQEILAEQVPGKFEVTLVERLADALAQIKTAHFDAALCDLNLPDSTGLETAQAIVAAAPTLALVVLTGIHDEALGHAAIEFGAQDYLFKGETKGLMIARTLHYAIERKHLENQLKEAKEMLERRVAERTEQLQRTFMETVNLVTTLSEMRDPYTAGHERRVAAISVAIGSEMGLNDHQLEGLRIGGYLDDVGKTLVPIDILVKPGKISSTEYELVKLHPQAGYDILKNVDFPWPVAQMALQHHERMDGSGYPNGLKGEEILLEARIMAVADVVEAMSSHRPYRPGLGIDKALAEIERGKGTAYDPVAVDACLDLFRNKGYMLPS